MIRKLLLSFLFFLLSLFTFGKNTSALNITTLRANYFSDKISIVAGTITSTSTGGNWSDASSWVGGVVPTATDDVVIASGATITIAGTTNDAKTLTINGNLLVSNTVTLNSVTQITINGLLSFADNNSNIHLPSGTAVKINSPGKVDDTNCSNNVAIYIGNTKFAACTGNGGQPIYKSFTDLNNSGGTISAIASSNSPVCLNGTINLSGSYSGTAGTKTSGGSTGVNYSWSVKAPDGTTTTSNTQNYNLTASQTGTYTAILTCTTYYGSDLSTSTSTITVAVTNQPFSITSVTVPTAQCLSSATVTIQATPAGLPIGNYTVTYARNDPWAINLSAAMTVTTAGTGTFTATGLTNAGNAGTTVTVTNLASGSCSNAITANNVSNTFVMRAALSPPTLDGAGFASCSNYVVQILNQSPNATNYYLDVSTSNAFGTYLAGYQNKDLGTTFQHTIIGLTPGTQYYYRFRSANVCGTTANSAVGSFTAPAATGGPTPTFTAAPSGSVCANTSVTYTTQSGKSNYQWTVPGNAGSDYTISGGGIGTSNNSVTLTWLTSGSKTVTVNYSSGGCLGSTQATNTITVNPSVAASVSIAASPTGSICSGTSVTFTATPTNGGSNPSYVWKLNGNTRGTNSPTFTSTTLANNDVVTVVMTSNLSSCLTGNPATSNGITMTVNTAPSITTHPANPATTCSGSGTQSMTVVATGTGLTYQWRKGGTPITNGGVISGATSATLTLTNPTTADAGNYDVVVSGTCPSAVTSNTATVTIYAPTITNAAQAKTCANRHVTYSTQGGKTNYIWSVSGVLNTDYKIIDRGTATDNYIVIEWLTIGSKTVSVNYTNPSGCSTSAAGTYTTEIVILDKGQVNGGKHICPGDTMPTLTFNTYANSSIRYPDTSVIVKWQYSDGNNTNYQDIPGTAGLTSYTPSAISGTTRQYRVMVDNGTCTDTSIYSAIDIDVTTAITGQSTAGQSVCSGTAFTPISVTAVGTPRGGQSSVEYQWYINTTNSNSGGTPLATAKTNTYTPQAGTAGISYYYYCIVTGNCSTATSVVSGAFITNANPTAPSASVTTQPTCSGVKGTITITGISGLTYSINGTDYYNQTVFGSLDPGTYIVTAKNASGCISQPGTSLQVNIPVAKTWTGATSTDWNIATNWSPSGIPTSSDCVIIPSGVTKSPVISDTSIDSNAYTLTVNDKASLVVEASNTLKVYGAVKVLSSATTSGSLLFKNNSSLIQTDTSPSINSGNISYQRTSLPIRQADYVYWSTPVQNQTLREVSPLTDPSKLYAYDGSQWVFTPNWTIMTVGKGYIIRGPENYSNTNRQSYAATFIGTPNNGTLTGETVLANKFYLVGNPYPSALDANKFILENKNILKGTLYFWTHNTPVVLGGAYQYNTDDYASYNVTGGVKTAAPTGTVSGNNNDKPSGQIGAGQAFFVGTNGAGTITFTNLMRSGGNDNSQFFKPGNTSKTASTEKHRVWLNMTNEGGAFKQLLVGYVEGATNNVETIYDGATFDGNKYLDFYSVNGSSKLVIQGRALPFSDTDIVPLGYKTTIAGEFTIAIDEADGNLATQKIYLEDKTTGTINDLTQSNYTFTTTAGTFADRFVLRYTNKSLGTGDFENIENGVLISVKDKTIKVLSSKENLKEISIYDISGRVLYNKTKVNSTELQISNLQSSNQVLIVKVTLDNDFTISKKVIFN